MIDVSQIDEQNINLIAHNNSKHKQSNIVSVILAEFKVPHIPAASLNQKKTSEKHNFFLNPWDTFTCDLADLQHE